MSNPQTAVVLLIDRLNAGAAWLARWAVLLMLAIGIWNVIGRYMGSAIGINLSSSGLIEAQWYLFDLIFLLGLGWTLQNNGHVRVDVLQSRWPAHRRQRQELAELRWADDQVRLIGTLRSAAMGEEPGLGLRQEDHVHAAGRRVGHDAHQQLESVIGVGSAAARQGPAVLAAVGPVAVAGAVVDGLSGRTGEDVDTARDAAEPRGGIRDVADPVAIDVAHGGDARPRIRQRGRDFRCDSGCRSAV